MLTKLLTIINIANEMASKKTNSQQLQSLIKAYPDRFNNEENDQLQLLA